MFFQTEEIWGLMREADDREICIRANDIKDAYTYIATHRQKYQTRATLSVRNAHWVEFGLLTPAAKIIVNSDSDLPENTVVSPTKITWGREDDGVAMYVTIQ